MKTITRRTFIKVAGTAVAVTYLPPPVSPSPTPAPALPASWMAAPGKARFRIDGIEKVTGAKIFARDFHARHMDGWPQHENRVHILRAVHADRPFLKVDLGALADDQQPVRVITGKMPGGILYDLIVREGNVPDYFGQPVAFLVFDNRKAYRAARQRLRPDSTAIRYGKSVRRRTLAGYSRPLNDFVRVAGDDPSRDVFSFVQNGEDMDEYNSEARRHAALIDAEIDAAIDAGDWSVQRGEFSMQAMDPVFMEPESGLAWYDRQRGKLHLVLGTQTPDKDLADILTLLSSYGHAPIRAVELTACYLGGAFGGRTNSVFSLYIALAATFSNAPVRLAYDRFEQFQAGLKRHACDVRETLAIDRSGAIQALKTEMIFDGGGRQNLSSYVADQARICAAGSYRIPRAAVHSRAVPSVDVSGGSQRGFGAPQAFFAIETLIDQAAAENGWDPIDLRLRNLLATGERTVVGGPIHEPLRLDEICRIARDHPLWQNRLSEKKKRQAAGKKLYGVGFALAMKPYGTASIGVQGYVSLNEDGTLLVRTNAVDMGNGSATTLAISTARYCGANASRIEMGNVDAFAALELVTGKGGDWSHPRWVKKKITASAACVTAFHQVHAIEQASRILFETALLPAARKLWGDDVAAVDTSWQDAALTAPGRRPLPLGELAGQIYASGAVTGAMVHASFHEKWVSAQLTVDGRTRTWPIDALALFKAGNKKAILIDRRNVTLPAPDADRCQRHTFTPCGNLVAVEVDAASGRVRVTDSVSVLDAGRILTWDLVEGQSQGGVAMAIGYTLLEDMPAGLAGPAAGDWNLNRYRVPMARDMPGAEFQLITLDPLDGGAATAKGIAEAVMCAVPAAIANALAAATRQRLRSLPITAEKVLAALRRTP